MTQDSSETPTAKVHAVSKDALLEVARAVLAPNGAFETLVALCDSGSTKSIYRIMEPYIPHTIIAYSQLSAPCRQFLGGNESSQVPTMDAVLRFERDASSLTKRERADIDEYFLHTRLIGHMGLAGEFGNGIGQPLMYASKVAHMPEAQDKLLQYISRACVQWDNPSQLSKQPMGQLPRYKRETVGRAMNRISEEIKAWMPVMPDASREQLKSHIAQYDDALQKIAELMDMGKAYFGAEKLQTSQVERT